MVGQLGLQTTLQDRLAVGRKLLASQRRRCRSLTHHLIEQPGPEHGVDRLPSRWTWIDHQAIPTRSSSVTVIGLFSSADLVTQTI
jgi:hypothetical protein